ncbi:hypothetical protein MLD38_012091 [Melastoma candidum]|uniref:Uncharacterized protein n=1 Tax=Melastoma candidum TaxID=119954 RepID=A0ACB9RDL5_9MYRT|nr:hypothetical protein MLD38_012091 [Melastoma candidum]
MDRQYQAEEDFRSFFVYSGLFTLPVWIPKAAEGTEGQRTGHGSRDHMEAEGVFRSKSSCSAAIIMPLFELLRTMRSKPETNPAPSSTPADPSPTPGRDFVELVWEDGQILAQGQSQLNRPWMTSSNTGLVQPRNCSEAESGQKAGNIRGLEFGQGEIGLGKEGNAVPWLSYPFNGSLHCDDFCNDLLPELPGIAGVTDCRQHLGCNTSDSIRLFENSVGGEVAVAEAGPVQPGNLSPDSSALQQQQQQQQLWLPFLSYRSSILEDAGNVKAMAAEDQGRVCWNEAENGQTGCVATEDGGIMAEEEKIVDNGTSSVCSANTVERGTCYPKHCSKRKSRDDNESDGPSEDLDGEPAIEKTRVSSHPRGTALKRSRAAEVHNLSERRRRDRINEKMRTLQDLIPNCSKADKASLLDEAIKYLKMLQLQVQMMTMGAGLYMPPFPHTGIGVGRVIGYGGMDLNASNSVARRPAIHITPPVHGAQFPAMHHGTLQRAFSNPGQGIPMSMPKKSLQPTSATSLVASAVSRHGAAPATTGSSSMETVLGFFTPTKPNPVCPRDQPPTQSGALRSALETSDTNMMGLGVASMASYRK